MYNKIKQPATFKLPFSAVKCLYKSMRGKKIVCEIDISALKKINDPNTIDEMFAEARIEYFTGRTKSFTDTKKLMAYLNG